MMHIQAVIFFLTLTSVSHAQIQKEENNAKLEPLSGYNASNISIPSTTLIIQGTTSNSSIMTSNSSTISNSTLQYATITSFEPSMHTHFSVSDSHNITNSSDSTKATQKAPYPDDSIGKHGRLHLSSASYTYPHLFLVSFTALLLFYIILTLY